MKEADFVKHANWRQILGALTSDDMQSMWAVSVLYDDTLGVNQPAAFSEWEVDEARGQVGKPRSAGDSYGDWNREDLANLIETNLGYSKTICEAYVDHVIMEVAQAGKLPGLEPDRRLIPTRRNPG